MMPDATQIADGVALATTAVTAFSFLLVAFGINVVLKLGPKAIKAFMRVLGR